MHRKQPARDHGRKGPLSAHERPEGSEPGDPPLPPGKDDLIDQAPCGLAVLDLRGKILFSNAALRGMIGQKESAPTERYFQDLLPQGGKLFYETQFIPTLLLRGTIAEISFELLGPDEMRIPVQ